jgi:hypothetical protein
MLKIGFQHRGGANKLPRYDYLELKYCPAPAMTHSFFQSVKYPDEAHLAKYDEKATGTISRCLLAYFIGS